MPLQDDLQILEEKQTRQQLPKGPPPKPMQLQGLTDDLGIFGKEEEEVEPSERFFPTAREELSRAPFSQEESARLLKQGFSPEEILRLAPSTEAPLIQPKYDPIDVAIDVMTLGTTSIGRATLKQAMKASTRQEGLKILSKALGREMGYSVAAGGTMIAADMAGAGPIVELLSGILGPIGMQTMMAGSRQALIKYMKNVRRDPENYGKVKRAIKRHPDSGLARRLGEVLDEVDALEKGVRDIAFEPTARGVVRAEDPGVVGFAELMNEPNLASNVLANRGKHSNKVVAQAEKVKAREAEGFEVFAKAEEDVPLFGVSVEEAARKETFYKVDKNGTIHYLGVKPDASLREGESIIAAKPDGSLRVSNSREAGSDEAVLARHGDRIRGAFEKGREPTKPTKLEAEEIRTVQDYDFSEPYHRQKVNAIKRNIEEGQRPEVTIKAGDRGEPLATDGLHTLQAYKELGIEPKLNVVEPVSSKGTKPQPVPLQLVEEAGETKIQAIKTKSTKPKKQQAEINKLINEATTNEAKVRNLPKEAIESTAPPKSAEPTIPIAIKEAEANKAKEVGEFWDLRYDGAQEMNNKVVFYSFTDMETGGSLSIKPNDLDNDRLIADKIGRAKEVGPLEEVVQAEKILQQRADEHEFFLDKGTTSKRRNMLSGVTADNPESASVKAVNDALHWYHTGEGDIDKVRGALDQLSDFNAFRHYFPVEKEARDFSEKMKRARDFVDQLKVTKAQEDVLELPKGTEDVTLTSFPALPSGVIKTQTTDPALQVKNIIKDMEEEVSDFRKFGRWWHDRVEVTAPFVREGLNELGFNVKNQFSVASMIEEEGVQGVKALTKTGLGSARNFGEAYLIYESPKKLRAIKDPIHRKKIRAASKILKAYFKKSFKEYDDLGGLELPWPKSEFARLNKRKGELEDLIQKDPLSRKVDDWRNELAENRDRFAKLKGTNFAHIHTRMLFHRIYSEDPKRGHRILTILAQKKRKTPLISDLVDAGVKLEEVDARNAVANYARRKGKDISLLKILDAAKKPDPTTGRIAAIPASKAGTKGTEHYTSMDSREFPQFKGYLIHPYVARYLHEYTKFSSVGMGMYTKAVSATKMMQFYNPFFLPMYDMVQASLLGSITSFRADKNLYRGIRSSIKKDEHYWIAASEGLFSKPFNNPFDSYQSMVEGAKHGFLGRAFSLPGLKGKGLGKGALLFGPEVLKKTYNMSWNIAWELDQTVRMVSYHHLLGKGMEPRQAAQLAALYHGDYASVPPETRRMLNKVFFTPTFKVTMGKLYAHMIEGSAENASKFGFGGKETRIATKALLTMVAINQGFDMFMRSQGFERDQWGRRYYKRVDTDEGEKDLTFTVSHPANMPLKYYYRAKEAWQPSASAFMGDFFRKNKYDLTPLLRLVVYDFATNTKPDGTQIYSPGDDNSVKAIKSATYALTQIVRITSVLEDTKKDRETRQIMYQQFGKVLTNLVSPFSFAYLRKHVGERNASKIRGLERAMARDQREGLMTEDMMENYLRMLHQLSDEIEEKM